MSGYQILATRYRPRTFDEVVGQQDVARVLRHAVASERVAHAYLFSGPRGVGKTSMARILAKAVNCAAGEPGEPCGACGVCTGIDSGRGGLDVVEIDGASHNKVEDVRELIENVRFSPVEASSRIYIIDEVHMLSISAFNALLKTLEEPPAHALFILATTEPLKVPETIRSRCQSFEFRRLGATEIAARLREVCSSEEDVDVADDVLMRVARHARGGMRDALSLLDQLLTFGTGSPTADDFERLTGQLSTERLLELVTLAIDGDAAGALAAGQAAFERGIQAGDFVEQLAETLEGLLVVAAGGEPADRTAEEREHLAALAARTNVDHVAAMLDLLVEAGWRLRQKHEPRLVVEMTLVHLARLGLLEPVSEAIAALREGGGDAPAAQRAPAPTRKEPRPAAPPRREPAPDSWSTSGTSGAPRAPAPDAQETGSQPPSSPSAASVQPADDATSPKQRLLAELGRSARVRLSDADVELDGQALRIAVAADVAADAPLVSKVRRAAGKAFGPDVTLDVLERARGAAPTSDEDEPPPEPPPDAAGPESLGDAAPSPNAPPAAEESRKTRRAERGAAKPKGSADRSVDDPARRALDLWPGSEEVDIE